MDKPRWRALHQYDARGRRPGVFSKGQSPGSVRSSGAAATLRVASRTQIQGAAFWGDGTQRKRIA